MHNRAQNPTKPMSFWDLYKKAIYTGAVVGSVSSTVTYPIDKVAFYYQTVPSKVSPTFIEAIYGAFKYPLRGYFPGVFNSASKNVILFPVRAGIERQLHNINPGSAYNSRVADFSAGTATVYLTSPLAFFKARRYNNMSVADFYKAFTKAQATAEQEQLKLRDVTRGIHAKAIRDGVQVSLYFAILKILSDYTQYPILSGVGANIMASFFSNPLSVISSNQQVAPVKTNMVDMGWQLYEQGGLARFYRGFFKTTTLRMGAQGGAIAGGIKLYETIHARENIKKPEM